MEKIHRIDCMIRAMNIIREAAGYIEDKEYMKIHSLMNEYLKNNCEHDWEKDMFDIGGDSYQTIIYCKKCLNTK